MQEEILDVSFIPVEQIVSVAATDKPCKSLERYSNLKLDLTLVQRVLPNSATKRKYR
jgi:hypothetical protein